jgi:hypothetical protein
LSRGVKNGGTLIKGQTARGGEIAELIAIGEQTLAKSGKVERLDSLESLIATEVGGALLTERGLSGHLAANGKTATGELGIGDLKVAGYDEAQIGGGAARALRGWRGRS